MGAASVTRRAVWSLAAGCIALALAGASTPTAAAPAAGKPPELVVLLHGLGRSAFSMRRLAGRLEDAGFAVTSIDYDSLDESPAAVTRDVTRQIDACCAHVVPRVHFVGHSLGGLLIRAYLRDRRVAHLGRVVLLGTPNQGTPVVDHYRRRWWLQLLGSTALALGTDAGSFPARLPPPDYPVGVIAGRYHSFDNEQVLPGEDDGLVPVASTRLEGMTDFIVLPVSHWAMRSDPRVARQVVAFLRRGRFLH